MHPHDSDCIVVEIKSITICQNMSVMVLKMALRIRNGNHDSLYIRWPTNCRVTTVKFQSKVYSSFAK